MKRSFLVFVAVMGLLALVLSACAPLAQPGSASGGDTGSKDEFVKSLEARGAEVQLGEEIEQPFLSVTGQTMKVNGADVQVFEYSDDAARQAEAAKIPEDGSTFETTIVDWIDQPHFWANGRLIVLYVGSDQAIVDLLSEVLGNPIAG